MIRSGLSTCSGTRSPVFQAAVLDRSKPLNVLGNTPIRAEEVFDLICFLLDRTVPEKARSNASFSASVVAGEVVDLDARLRRNATTQRDAMPETFGLSVVEGPRIEDAFLAHGFLLSENFARP
jgi:hypothetical protein